MAVIADEAGFSVEDEAGGLVLDEAGLPSTVDPAWSAARTGLPGSAAAPNYAAQVAQFLTAHAITPVYAGAQIVIPSGNVGYGFGGIDWVNLGVSDVDQPFAMPAGKTAVGRVTLPLSPSGDGADVTVSLCADSGGSPGTVIASTRLPAAWLAQLAAPGGPGTGGPLATAASGTLRMGEMTSVTWASPVTGTAPALPSVTVSGNFLYEAGGTVSGAPIAGAYTIGWGGGSAPGTVLPQPSLPAATGYPAIAATADTIVCAGGQNAVPAPLANVWAASWSPSTGIAGAWSAQAALPQATSNAAAAAWGSTVYVIGGQTTGGDTGAVYRAAVSNGQITAWTVCPPLPIPALIPATAAVNGWLIAAGVTSGSLSTVVYGAQINSDGSIGGWQAWPPLRVAAAPDDPGCSLAVTACGIALIGGGGAAAVQTLTVTADGPGQWQSQTLNTAAVPVSANPCAAFPLGTGTWETFAFTPGNGYYASGVLSSVPVISVPLPATGLTSGATYHILVHQDGGDLNDYASIALDPGALATAAQTRPSGGGSWTPLTHTYSMLAGIWDQTAGGQVLHTWEDSGARITAMVYAGSGGQLLGLCEATAFEDGAMLPAVTQIGYDSAGQVTGLAQLA
jgi:hypothetical protein